MKIRTLIAILLLIFEFSNGCTNREKNLPEGSEGIKAILAKQVANDPKNSKSGPFEIDSIKFGDECESSAKSLYNFVNKNFPLKNPQENRINEIKSTKDTGTVDPIDWLVEKIKNEQKQGWVADSRYKFKEVSGGQFSKSFFAFGEQFPAELFCNEKNKVSAYFKSPFMLEPDDVLSSLRRKYGSEVKSWTSFKFHQDSGGEDGAFSITHCWHFNLVRYFQFEVNKDAVIIFLGEVPNKKCTPWQNYSDLPEEKPENYPSESSFGNDPYKYFRIGYYDPSVYNDSVNSLTSINRDLFNKNKEIELDKVAKAKSASGKAKDGL